jgi:Lrp/AsnC family transcriptional regulator for asnA, asnC and gidA
MIELDKTIVDCLSKNARMSFRQIAKKTDKSTDTIINHYNNLKKDGDIRGSTIVLDIEKIGYEGIAAFEIDTTSSRNINTDTILEKLIKMPNVIVATKTVGEHNLLVPVVIHDLKHYQKISVDIADILGVKDISSSIWSGNKIILPKYFII